MQLDQGRGVGNWESGYQVFSQLSQIEKIFNNVQFFFTEVRRLAPIFFSNINSYMSTQLTGQNVNLSLWFQFFGTTVN